MFHAIDFSVQVRNSCLNIISFTINIFTLFHHLSCYAHIIRIVFRVYHLFRIWKDLEEVAIKHNAKRSDVIKWILGISFLISYVNGNSNTSDNYGFKAGSKITVKATDIKSMNVIAGQKAIVKHAKG